MASDDGEFEVVDEQPEILRTLPDSGNPEYSTKLLLSHAAYQQRKIAALLKLLVEKEASVVLATNRFQNINARYRILLSNSA